MAILWQLPGVNSFNQPSSLFLEPPAVILRVFSDVHTLSRSLIKLAVASAGLYQLGIIGPSFQIYFLTTKVPPPPLGFFFHIWVLPMRFYIPLGLLCLYLGILNQPTATSIKKKSTKKSILDLGC